MSESNLRLGASHRAAFEVWPWKRCCVWGHLIRGVHIFDGVATTCEWDTFAWAPSPLQMMKRISFKKCVKNSDPCKCGWPRELPIVTGDEAAQPRQKNAEMLGCPVLPIWILCYSLRITIGRCMGGMRQPSSIHATWKSLRPNSTPRRAWHSKWITAPTAMHLQGIFSASAKNVTSAKRSLNRVCCRPFQCIQPLTPSNTPAHRPFNFVMCHAAHMYHISRNSLCRFLLYDPC